MNEVHIIYSLFGSAEEAEAVCKTLLSERLIACANRLAPATSHYEWDGEAQESEEYPVIFKTTASRAKAVVARIAELHSYDTPAIIAWPAARSHGPFAGWVAEQVAAK